MKLEELAFSRSGDKGDHANIALFAFDAEGYKLLVDHITEQKVASYFGALHPSKVERFLLPKLLAINFVLYDALGGGGSYSLRFDSQGKALGQALLQMRLK